jgi:hypothetical protein
MYLIKKISLEFLSGNNLYSFGQSYKRTEIYSSPNDNYSSGLYTGYIAGVIAPTSIGGLFCPPNDITVGQAADIVFKYLDSHTEIRNIQANFLVVKAMTDAYPCKTK